MPCSYPEAARERDLHRYYRPWLDAQSLVDSDGSGEKGLTYDGYRPKTSRDKSLTAFAQLATLRLNARRAMVSLIDSHRQYILAEATKTLSLLSPKAENPKDEVWLGNVILNKTDAVCYHTFTSTYATKEENGDTFVAECMVVPDCRLDPRFADRDYVKGEPGVRFYAGVPIITKAGYRIGVYAISDESPREGLSAVEVRFMQDVASAVMEHLELAKDSLDRSKGERMVRGLTQFIEHSATTDMQESSTRPTTLERQTENVRLGALEEDQAHVAAQHPHRQSSQKRETESEINRIFQRAARIMRSSTEADGVVFFDTSTAGIKVHLHDTSPNAASSDESGTHNTTTDFDTGDSTTTTRRRRGKSEATFADAGGSDAPHSHSKPCPVVGLSLREGVASLVHTDFTFTEATMERYIHRYPYGKFFNYNEEGHGINSSDEKSERSETDQSDRTQTSPTGPRRPRKRRERFIPTEFLKVLPNVRTLIFLPLWDSASERWVAGGFIWTTQAGRLMSPENELPYLQAFGNSITNEVARRTAQKADRAKTTFIASISHELRSPLHGILGSVEFLRDTDTTAYQQSLVASIDTCGRTLLDTIDHVLDYAKINKLRSTNARRKQRTEGRTKRQPADNSILGVTADFDLAQLVEEVCDTVCTGHTFRKTHNISGSAIYDQAESVGSQSLLTNGEQLDHTVVAGRDTHGSVIVSLHVEPAATWVVRSQPGALRRIVMNLLGNSLKYTDSGFIAIHLMQSGRLTETGLIELTLTVEDSGRGMSPEYQRTKLFSPFSQEDPFSSGTGLGLSIVKQIVESFKGEIDVESTLHVGTAIGVSMRLPIGTSSPDHDRLRAPMELRGQGVSIACEPDTRGADRGVKTRESMHLACQGLKMDITDEKNVYASIAEVDFLLTDSPSLDQLIHSPCANRINKNPLSVVCVCTDTAERTAMENRLSRQIEALSWVAEVVTQPCGPRKLARALLACQKRATQHAAERSLTRSVSDMSVQQTNSLTVPPPTQRTVSETYSQELVQQQQQAADAHAQAHAALQQGGGDTSAQDSPPLPLALPKTITPTSPLRSVDTGEYFSPRVLLVDDNAINLKLLVVFAQRQQLRYISASNGLDAYETYRTEALSTTPPTRPFDFVLMDLSMPVMDGLTSTRQIRAFEAREGIPRSTIVALTGLASERDQKDAQEAGVDMYLVKPVKFADIKRVFGGKV